MNTRFAGLKGLRTGRVMIAIFQHLVRNRVAYAWEMCRDLNLKEGSVYPALETLLVWNRVELLADPSSAPTVVDGRALRRRYYTLTEEGWTTAELELRRRNLWTPSDDLCRARARRRTATPPARTVQPRATRI